jgi:hypothetical protein
MPLGKKFCWTMERLTELAWDKLCFLTHQNANFLTGTAFTKLNILQFFVNADL